MDVFFWELTGVGYYLKGYRNIGDFCVKLKFNRIMGLKNWGLWIVNCVGD